MDRITIISGEKHSGKTTKLLEIITELKSKNKTCAGIVAIGILKNNNRYSFNIQDITTQENMPLMSVDENPKLKKIGRFYINPLGFQFGEQVLKKAINSNPDYIIIDEIGSLELSEDGWFHILKNILKTEQKIIFTVRNKLINQLIKKFNISEYKLIKV